MWFIELPHWWGFVVRAAVVYTFLVVILRISGKRQVGQLAPFDLVLLLVLSDAVQNSMNGGDNSITGGLISATTLVGLNWLVGHATFRSKRLEALIEGRPVVLVHDGNVDHRAGGRLRRRRESPVCHLGEQWPRHLDSAGKKVRCLNCVGESVGFQKRCVACGCSNKPNDPTGKRSVELIGYYCI